MDLMGLGGLYFAEDFNKALKTWYSEFIGVGRTLMLFKDLGTLLKEGKKNKICMAFDFDHPELY